jgi:hypothetical protein
LHLAREDGESFRVRRGIFGGWHFDKMQKYAIFLTKSALTSLQGADIVIFVEDLSDLIRR